MSSLATGCGSVWLERSVRDAEAARSNRAIPTIKKQTGSSEAEAGARFFMLQAACVRRVPPVSVMVGRMVRLSAQRRSAYPDPVQSAGARSRTVRVPASPRAFSRADGSPAFAGRRQVASRLRQDVWKEGLRCHGLLERGKTDNGSSIKIYFFAESI